MGRKKLVTLFLAAAGVAMAPAAWADTKAGIDAWNAGDFVSAVNQWQEPAARGEAEAQFRLGQAYRLGKGAEQDLTKSEEMFAKAASQGHREAADNYGLLLFHRGEKKQALRYLRSASDRGDARAQYLLGLAYFNADNVERDWPRAYALVNLARKQGLEQANSALQQIDQHITPDQRAQGLALAGELQAKIEGRPLTPPAKTAVAVAEPRNPVTPVRAAVPSKTPAAKPVSARPTATPAKPLRAKVESTGPWRVQLGSFAERGNADALWNRVKHRSELAGKARINTSLGKITRLQAGGFATQSAAQSACNRLKSAGFDCIAISG